MSFLRSLLYALWLAVTVMPWALAVLVVSIFLRGAPLYWMCVGWLRVAILGARWICGIRWRVRGMERLPDGPAILLSKHQSTWETFAYPCLMPRPLSYVFKRELLYIPFFGWAIARLDMVHIDRSKRTEAWNKVAEQGRRFMEQGNWVIMFPEGTRTPRGGQGPYKAGGSRLAVATGAPVVPIAVTSARCWPRNAFIKRPGLVEVSIGSPIPTAGRDADEVMREVEAWIEAEMRRLDAEAYAASPGSAAPAGLGSGR
ncbi:1-acyl-sn-glycerol-3-phosphate acyltransferase [Aquabacterium sp. A7-Y]|uniref:lysophospholipid acyltransferase family protein n=1 Tax=Aquabacterium sp. A7-Y TaxID=1349605 RepID=UPI00223E50B5|nr:lysophospholipid acyltransferase family protein [Aquabacterium sp. A7-Y]MCW7537256.1 1-acyl-sn-glycerol-3-phosphate acyltransferase [Aquabacterium sp. A7-Y]